MEKQGHAIASGLFLAGLGYLIFQVLREFLEPVAWAAILVYATWPLHQRVASWLRGRRGWSAVSMTLLLGTLIVVPLVWASILLREETVYLFRRLPAWLEGKPTLPEHILGLPYVGEELRVVLDQYADVQSLLRRHVLPWFTGVSGKLLGMLEDMGFILAKLLMTLFLTFFLYCDGSLLVGQLRSGLELALGNRVHAYLDTMEITIRAVVYGIVLTALAQGAVAGLGYWGVGLEAPVFLAVCTAFIALIPFGTPVAWGSAAVWLLFSGQIGAGIALLLWGTLVVSWVDNVVRPLVISRTTRIPFVLVFLGVLGGLAAFGFIGLFVGPVILAVGLAVWREWLQSGGSGAEAPV